MRPTPISTRALVLATVLDACILGAAGATAGAMASPVAPAPTALASWRGPSDTPHRDGLLRHRRHRTSDYLHFVTLQYGTYDPKGAPDGGSFLGLRTGAEFDNRLTLSFNVDAYWRSYVEETTIAREIDRNGNLITSSVTSFETSSALVPLGVSLGLRLPGSRSVTPFVGVGIAYEILVNDVHDHTTGLEDTNVYAGPGWQVFGGLMVPVTRGARLLGELWVNDAEVSRDIEAHEYGLPVRETIDVSGLGARLGVELYFD